MDLVIIGNGISGITTALEFRKKDQKSSVTIISDESDYFYSRPALMYIFMGDMTLKDTRPYENKFWADMKINLVIEYVV